MIKANSEAVHTLMQAYPEHDRIIYGQSVFYCARCYYAEQYMYFYTKYQYKACIHEVGI
jgi:hypothetical protein